MQNPQSRNEAILQSMIDGTEYTDPPQSRIESLLLQLKEVVEAGSGEIVVDGEISKTSTHPVQNKVIAANLLSAIAGITPNSSGSMELDSEDLNDFTTSGIYNAMNCENAPFNDMALVILGHSMDSYCVQIACDVASGNFKFRNQIDGNWTAWGDNILSTLEAHTAAINELENNTKSIQTATGNPLTIQASESNLVECVAEVEAVQDLHGYDHPWVGGAGKNKLPLTVEGIKAVNTSGTWSGNTLTKNNGTFEILTNSDNNVTGIRVNGTFSAVTAFNLPSPTLPSGSYALNGCPSGLSGNVAITIQNIGNDEGSGATFTLSAQTTPNMWIGVKNGYTANNLIFYPMIRLATETDSGFAPYTNICPISGRSEVAIQRVGKNLFGGLDFANALHAKSDYGTIDTTNKTVSFNRASNSSPIFEYPFKENTQYTFIYSGNTESASQKNTSILFEYTDGTESAAVNLSSNTKGTYTIQSISGKTIKSIDLRWANGANAVLYYDECGLFEGVLTTSDFEPYQGKTYTIQLGDTIYGGELDVLSGELVVTHSEVDLGSLTWSYNAQYSLFYSALSDGEKTGAGYGLDSALCSTYNVSMATHRDINNGEISVGNNVVSSATCGVVIKDSRYTDATTFKTAVTGQQLVYELATPYTIQLTPQQIRLLKGTNHLSCNGDLTIKYYPDNVLGQLKGDIESEYDERIVNLEEKAENALKIKSITTTTATNQQGISTQSYDNYVQGDKKLIPVSIIAKTTGYDAVDVHYVLDETNRLIYFIPKDLTGSAIPSGRTVSMTIYYFEI